MRRYFLILALLFSLLWRTAPVYGGLTAPSFSLLPGQTAEVPVSMSPQESCTALMFDIAFPSEVRLKQVALGNAATASHTVSFSLLPNGLYRVVAFSSQNETFLATGSLVVLTIEDGDKNAGQDSIRLLNQVFTAPSGTETESQNATVVFSAALHGTKATAPAITQTGKAVTIAAGGNPCYYTTDGSEPSRFGTLYTEPITVNRNFTVRAIATEPGKDKSETSSLDIFFSQVEQPVIVFQKKTVTISSATPGAAIHYTLDGSDPTESSPTYTTPFSIRQDTRVKAIALKDAYKPSQIAEAYFTLPTLSLQSFSIKPGETVKVSLGCSGLSGHTALMFDVVFSDELRITNIETSEGAAPSHSASCSNLGNGRFRAVVFSSENAIFSSENILRISIEGGDMKAGTGSIMLENLVVTSADGKDEDGFSSQGSYQSSLNGVRAATPTLSVSNNILTIQSDESNCYFTLDGTEPSRFGTLYTGPVTLTRNCTIKAIAVSVGKDKSPADSLVVTSFVVDTPAILWDNQHCTLECSTPEAVIYYTQDGSDPTSNKAIAYKKPFYPLGNVTIQACAKRDGYTTSEIATLVLDTFQVALPSIVFHNDTLLLATATKGASVYYTTDNTIPTNKSKRYTEPVILKGNLTVKAIAFKERYIDSDVAVKQLEWFKVATPEVIPVNDTTYAISCSTPGATIYYTTDGSEPTTESAIYSKPFVQKKDFPLKSFATKELYRNSDTLSQQVTVFIDMVILNDLELAGEETGSLVVSLNNRTPFVAMMLDINLPTGLVMCPDTTLVGLSRLTTSHQLSCRQIGNGVYRVVIFSSDNTPFEGNEGGLFVMPVYAANTTPTGKYDIKCSTVFCTTEDGKDKELPSNTASFRMNPYPQTVATPSISVDWQKVTLACSTPGAEIHYTLDGTCPTSKSPAYTEPFTIQANLTVKAIGIHAGSWNKSSVATTVVNHLKVPTPSFFLIDGKTAVFDCPDENAVIYYSLKNTKQFKQYTGAFTLSSNTIVNVFACRDGWHPSDTVVRTVSSVNSPYLELSNLTCISGEEGWMHIYLHTDKTASAYQFDIALPDGISFVESSFTPGGRRSASHLLSTALKSDSSLRVVCFSPKNESLPETNEPLFSFKVTAAQVASPVCNNACVKNISFSTSQGAEYPLHDAYSVISVAPTHQLYHLTYKLEEDTLCQQTFTYHEFITPMAGAARTGFTFLGWEGEPTFMPAHDVTVEGHFAANRYLLTYLIDDDYFYSDSVAFGSVITPVTYPVMSGHYFSGWLDLPDVMPAHDVTVHGSLISPVISPTLPDTPFDVYDLHGRPVLRKTMKDDLQALPRGTYIIEGKIYTLKK